MQAKYALARVWGHAPLRNCEKLPLLRLNSKAVLTDNYEAANAKLASYFYCTTVASDHLNNDS